MLKFLIIVIAAILFTWFAYQNFNDAFGDDPEPVACTMEARQCPDGSWVGRSGPNCEFVCPGSE